MYFLYLKVNWTHKFPLIANIVLATALLVPVNTYVFAKEVFAKEQMHEVTVDSGILVGRKLDNGTMGYLGIPYAAPPIGNLRWRPPQPPPKWSEPKQTFSYSPSCPQPDMSKIALSAYKDSSEDCLYLNVWHPRLGPINKPHPVMVWIHGGGYTVGSASDDFYNGRDLALSGDVVVVTFNYRLGPFGFLAHPALSQESEHKVSGNYGLLDQIQALQWIHSNISAFGGDPNNITVFGESAGSRSITNLMIAPPAKGLFHKAILQSSTAYRPMYHLREKWYGRDSMETVGIKLAKELDIQHKSGENNEKEILEKLRQFTTTEIMTAAKPSLPGMLEGKNKKQNGYVFEPAVDGWLLPGSPSDLFDAGEQIKIPVLAGSNADEGSLFARKIKFLNARRARRIIEAVFPENAEEILRLYPFDDRHQARKALNHISRDMNSTSPMRNIVSNVNKINSDSWLYYFSYVRSDRLGQVLGAWHGSEIRFIFNSLDRGRTVVTDEDRALATIMSKYWVNFAKTGNPNSDDLPNWPKYTNAEESFLEIGSVIKAGKELHRDKINLFSRLEVNRRKSRGVLK